MPWTFASLPYERPDFEIFTKGLNACIDRVKAATTYGEARTAYMDMEDISIRIASLATLVSIRNTMDMKDPFYEAEQVFFNQETAKLSPISKAANEALLTSPFRKDFEKEFGTNLTRTMEIQIKTQDKAIVPDLIAESDLCETYSKTVASCQMEFQGESVNFYGLLKHMESPDRDIRKAAYIAWAGMYESIADTLDDLYDKLIAVRIQMAEKLGLSSYTELAYLNMRRADYTDKEVAAFRKQVKEIITPAAARYRKAQAERIGVNTLRYYDESFMYPEGNADPVGGEAEMLKIAQDMYRELSPETGVFFDYMVEHGLFDLSTRPGKHLGGYCTGIFDKKAPFIFSNFNGTAADVGVLTHEAGHAFAYYTAARNHPLMDFAFSTSEVAEIHSMTMEHFTYPWLDRLYGPENAEKAQYAHLMEALITIPYLVCVDEFQHKVYENPTMTAAERKTLWRSIEKDYMPWRDYDGVDFLQQGGFWMQKQHIFLYPFYYIDYALAQVCAFELYGRMKEDKQAAWTDYLRLCEAGGSLGYFDLLRHANLSNPFAEGSLKKAVAHVIRELDAK